MMKKYKAVLFDMDGTTLDSLQDLTDAVNNTMNHFGFSEHTREECASFLGNGARYLIEHACPEGSDIDKVLEYYIPYYEKHCLDKTCPFDGMSELMDALKKDGFKLAIISNKPNGATKELADRFFGDLLDYSVGESEKVKRKPSPDAVLDAINEFGLEKEDCVYIGDTEVDINTAVNAGIDCIAVTWGFRTPEQLVDSGATVFAHDCGELYSLLTGQN